MYDIIITEASVSKPNIHSIALHVPFLQCDVQKCFVCYVACTRPGHWLIGWSVDHALQKRECNVDKGQYITTTTLLQTSLEECFTKLSVLDNCCGTFSLLPVMLLVYTVTISPWWYHSLSHQLRGGRQNPPPPGCTRCTWEENSVGIFNSKPFSHPIASV